MTPKIVDKFMVYIKGKPDITISNCFFLKIEENDLEHLKKDLAQAFENETGKDCEVVAIEISVEELLKERNYFHREIKKLREEVERIQSSKK